MPYRDVSELPDSVRKALPAHGQSIFLAAFNAASEQYDEERAFKVAWAAVNKKYHKNEKGEWIANMMNLSSGSSEVTSWHDVRLQRLDVFLNNGASKVFYDPVQFENVQAWDRIPVIFQKTSQALPGEHPDFNNVVQRTLDPAKYTTVGYLKNVRLSETGEPSLVGQIVFNNENCSLLSKANKLSLSTGFSALVSNGDDGNPRIAGPVQPNHVLVFKRGSCPNCYPNDNGAQFCNMQEDKKVDIMADEIKAEPVAAVQAEAPVEAPKVEAPVEAPVVETPKTDPLVELRKEFDAKFAVMEQRAADFEAKFMNLKWQQVKNTLPAAMVETAEKEGASRKMWEQAPEQFMNIVNMAVVAAPKVEAKPAEGVKFENTQKSGQDGFGVITFKR